MHDIGHEPNLEPEQPTDYSSAMKIIKTLSLRLPANSVGARAYDVARAVLMDEWEDMLYCGTHPRDLIADVNETITGLRNLKEEILEQFYAD